MNKIIGTLVFVSIVLSGCVSDSIEGTYLHGPEQINVYSDGTFVYKDLKNGIDYSGVVTKHGEEYAFSGSLLSFTAKMVDGNLSIDNDGGIYVKQK